MSETPKSDSTGQGQQQQQPPPSAAPPTPNPPTASLITAQNMAAHQQPQQPQFVFQSVHQAPPNQGGAVTSIANNGHNGAIASMANMANMAGMTMTSMGTVTGMNPQTMTMNNPNQPNMQNHPGSQQAAPMQQVQLIQPHQLQANSAYVQHLYNTQGQPIIMQPGNIALQQGMNPSIQPAGMGQPIQVITAGKAFQPGQITPHMITTGKQMIQTNQTGTIDGALWAQLLNSARNAGYTTIPTTTNQTLVIGQLINPNNQPNLMTNQSNGSKPNEMPKNYLQVVNGISPKSPIMSVAGTNAMKANNAQGNMMHVSQSQIITTQAPSTAMLSGQTAQLLSPLQCYQMPQSFGALPHGLTWATAANGMQQPTLLQNQIFIRGPSNENIIFPTHNPQQMQASMHAAVPPVNTGPQMTAVRPRTSDSNAMLQPKTPNPRPLTILPSSAATTPTPIRPASSVATQTSTGNAPVTKPSPKSRKPANKIGQNNISPKPEAIRQPNLLPIAQAQLTTQHPLTIHPFPQQPFQLQFQQQPLQVHPFPTQMQFHHHPQSQPQQQSAQQQQMQSPQQITQQHPPTDQQQQTSSHNQEVPPPHQMHMAKLVFTAGQANQPNNYHGSVSATSTSTTLTTTSVAQPLQPPPTINSSPSPNPNQAPPPPVSSAPNVPPLAVSISNVQAQVSVPSQFSVAPTRSLYKPIAPAPHPSHFHSQVTSQASQSHVQHITTPTAQIIAQSTPQNNVLTSQSSEMLSIPMGSMYNVTTPIMSNLPTLSMQPGQQLLTNLPPNFPANIPNLVALSNMGNVVSMATNPTVSLTTNSLTTPTLSVPPCAVVSSVASNPTSAYTTATLQVSTPSQAQVNHAAPVNTPVPPPITPQPPSAPSPALSMENSPTKGKENIQMDTTPPPTLLEVAQPPSQDTVMKEHLPMEHSGQTTSSLHTHNSLENTNKDPAPPRAIVRPRPQILTHVLGDFVIQESSEPFPVSRGLSESFHSNTTRPEMIAPEEPPKLVEKKMALDSAPLVAPRGGGSLSTCETCRKTDSSSKFKRHKRFCSSACAKKKTVEESNTISKSPLTETKLDLSDWGGKPAEKLGDANTFKVLPPAPLVSPNTNPAKSLAEFTMLPPTESEVSLDAELMALAAQQQLRSPSATPLPPVGGASQPVKEKPNFAKWTVNEVVDFVRNLPGCSDYAEDFALQEIDGQALMLLKADHLMGAMSMKLGPALKICARIDAMRNEANKPS